MDNKSSQSSKGGCQISQLTRRNLLDKLGILGRFSHQQFWGRLEMITFLKRIWPLEQMPSTDSRFETAEGDIWQHMVNNDDWDLDYLFDYLGLTGGNDDEFLRFLEEVTHPVVRLPPEQDEFVAFINKHLTKDGFELQPRDQISGYPIYRGVKLGSSGVAQNVKNLIFAADGPKPEIVLDDSISNNIRVVKNKEHCLIHLQISV
ncbi:MAG: hypothetical protein WCF84_14800 [Anaerolineae bacterium]